jgi:hypothetical protein
MNRRIKKEVLLLRYFGHFGIKRVHQKPNSSKVRTYSRRNGSTCDAQNVMCSDAINRREKRPLFRSLKDNSGRKMSFRLASQLVQLLPDLSDKGNSHTLLDTLLDASFGIATICSTFNCERDGSSEKDTFFSSGTVQVFPLREREQIRTDSQSLV